MATSLPVIALLTSSASAGANKKSLLGMAAEDDSIAAGSSKWNDVGYIQTKNTAKDNDEEPTDDNNLGISSLNKQK